MKRFAVVDLETVLDPDVPMEDRPSELVRMLKSMSKMLVERRRYGEMGDHSFVEVEAMLWGQERTFPQTASWKIACASVVTLDYQSCLVEKIGIVHGTTDEKITRNLADLVCDANVCLVTWNGRRFDVPVLEARCLRYGIPLPGFSRAWRYRYNDEAHYDVKDYLAAYGSVGSMMSLEQATRLIGLPGKPTGVDGSKVAVMIAEGRLPEVQAYCLSDAVGTAGVLIRTELMRGRLTISRAQEACASLLFACERDPRVQWMSDKANRGLFLMSKAQA